MGPCGNDSLYQTYLYKDELYHCNMASTVTAWAATQEGEFCTWGFGELAPVNDSTNSLDYTLTPS